ncbi:MAG: alpha/beta hydrolase family protein [Acidobacteriaceae bacterium]
MRPLEVAGFVLAIVPVLAILALVPVSVGVAAAMLSGAVLLLAFLWLGAYWQLLPLYLGVLLGLYALLWRKPRPRWIRVALAAAVTCLLILTAAFTYVLPMFSLPKPTGTYAIGTRIEHLVDPVRMETHVAGPPRPREIMVQIWYPAVPHRQKLASYRRRRETTLLSSYMVVLKTHSYRNAPVATSGAPFPVLLFNPEWRGQRTQNTYQVEDLASHGFIVVGVDHTYNSGPVAFPDGRVVRTTDVHDIADFQHTTVAEQIAIGSREVSIQAGDDVLVLNTLSAANLDPKSPWFHRVDADNAGAFGHSFGGAVAAEVCYRDPRVKAALNEDGWIFGEVATHGLDKPYLVMNDDGPAITAAQLNSTNVQTRRESKLTNADTDNLNHTMQAFGGYTLTIRGASHFDFSDRSLYSPIRRLTGAGTISPQRAHEIVEAYTLEFFSHTLLGTPAPLLAANRSPFKEVQFENWFAHNASTR